MPEVKLISESLFDSVAALASSSPRRRMNHNFHSGPADNPHRFLNILLRDTYIRPHRHSNPPKPETFLVLEGEAEVILFDQAGAVTARYRLGGQSADGHVWGIDIPAGIWHTILPCSERAVCFEVKPGPWEPSSDKEFAHWAPPEDAPSALEYARNLLDAS